MAKTGFLAIFSVYFVFWGSHKAGNFWPCCHNHAWRTKYISTFYFCNFGHHLDLEKELCHEILHKLRKRKHTIYGSFTQRKTVIMPNFTLITHL